MSPDDDVPPELAGLDTSLTSVVAGPAASLVSKSLKASSVGDLLHYYPRRYHIRGELTDLRDLRDGQAATVAVHVVGSSERAMARRGGGKMLIVQCEDDAGRKIALTFFSLFPHRTVLRAGVPLMASGSASVYVGQSGPPKWELKNAEYLVLDQTSTAITAAGDAFAGAIIPVYPSRGKCTSAVAEQAIRAVLAVLGPVAGPLPDSEFIERGLLPYGQALRAIHAPQTMDDADLARRSLLWAEAVVSQTALALRRLGADQTPTRPRRGARDGLLATFDSALPFPLTDDQRRAGEEIAADLSRSQPMHRLLQGEVGTGKTIVALRAMLSVADSGGQAVLLAPTEVLATQHYLDLLTKLGDLRAPGGERSQHVDVVLFTGSMSTAERKAALKRIAAGADLVVGTHALLSPQVSFRDLALVVVDEQHRFGIEQRDGLRARGGLPPHLMMMSATPIPRSVAMTVFGDLDVSSITQLPAGRKEIASHVVAAADNPAWVDRMWRKIAEEVSAGRQAFVVCPRITDSSNAGSDACGVDDSSDSWWQPALSAAGGDTAGNVLTAVDVLAEDLARTVLSDRRVAALHGQQPSEVKEGTMRAFAAGELDVLVSTTVIEVGVNVPNATVMVVMDADRFGMSQLHQLRGRVGRGSHPGLCLLHTATSVEHPARARLAAVAATRDGAELARVDLALRGEGDVLGAAQSGRRSPFRLLKVIEHEELIVEARAEAERIVVADPALRRRPMLREAIDLVVGNAGAFLRTG